MAPAKKKVKTEETPVLDAVLAADPPAAPPNDALIQEVVLAVAMILEHPVFNGIKSMEPKGIGAGALAVFRSMPSNVALRVMCVHTKAAIMCGYSICHAIRCLRPPIKRTSILWMQQHFWYSPSLWPVGLTVVGATHCASDVANKTVIMLTPPELIWSLLFAVRDDIRNGKTDDELAKWVDVMLTADVRLELVDNTNSRVWRCHQLRENAQQYGDQSNYQIIKNCFHTLVE